MHDEIVIEDLISPDERGMGELVLKGFEVNDYQYEEAMKTLRTNIQFSGSNIHAVMFTSSAPNEGKVRQHSSWRLPWPSWERRYC